MVVFIAGLAVFSSISFNLLLHFALGTAGVAGDAQNKENSRTELPYVQFGIQFISALFLWGFFNYAVPAFWKAFSVFFLVFPLSALVCIGLEILAERVLSRSLTDFSGIKRTFTALTAYDGLVPASLLISLAVADNMADAFILSLFFAIGNLIAMLILNEIRRRSFLEWVPQYLRGSPLILISIGLLSLIAASAAGMLFKILEVF